MELAPPPAPDPKPDPGAAGHAEAHATLRRILGAIEEYVYTGEFLSGDAYRVVFAGPCRERFLGMTVDQARTAVWADYVHPADMGVFDTAHRGAHETGRLDVEYRLIGADGVVRWVRDRGRMRGEDGRRLLDGSVLDVTAIRAAQEQLEAARAAALHASQVDPLTGALNRRSLTTRLEALGTQPVGVLSLDIDHFKAINDLHGHAAGDTVLVRVVERIRAAVREADAVFRMGGEEFLLLLPGVPDETALRDVAEAVRAGVEDEPVATPEAPIEVTVSVGAAHSAAPGAELDTLLAAADRAMYAAKRGGRNRVRLATAHAGADDLPGDQGALLRLAETVAVVAAAHDGGSADRSAAVSTLSARIARRLGGSPALVLRCRLTGLLRDVRVPALNAVPELRALAPLVGQSFVPFDQDARTPMEARIVAAAAAWLGMAELPPAAAVLAFDRLAGTRLDGDVVEALRSVLARPRERDGR